MASFEEEEELVFGRSEWAGESGEVFSAEHGFACFGSYWCWS